MHEMSPKGLAAQNHASADDDAAAHAEERRLAFAAALVLCGIVLGAGALLMHGMHQALMQQECETAGRVACPIFADSQ